MACASPLEPTEGKTRYQKWQMLLLEGGTLVLRDTFDTHVSKVSPVGLDAFLKKAKIRHELLKLHRNGKIKDEQKDLLYPQQPGQPDSATFDITLLSCLLQNVCGFNRNAMVASGHITPTDVSVEADIARLRTFRNKVCHSAPAAMTEQDYHSKCQDLEQVLLRLGKNVPDLSNKIDEYKSRSIDKECENALMEQLQEWENLDKIIQESISEIKAEQEYQLQTVTDLSSDIDDLKLEERAASQERSNIRDHVQQNKEEIEKTKDAMSNVRVEMQHREIKTETVIKQIDEKVTKTTDAQRELEGATQNVREDIDGVKATQEKMKKEIERVGEQRMQQMSSELKSLASMSKEHLEDAMDQKDLYVETRAHKKGKDILLENKILVISGHPGEGKTTMALNLAADISKPENFLRIRHPRDWEHVDFKLNLFDTFLIDDIYGTGVMDDKLVKKWDRYLPDVYKATQTKGINVIIATRHYILEDAKEIMKKQQIFKGEHVIQLASKDLNEAERECILKKHLTKSERSTEEIFIDECLVLYDDFVEVSLARHTRDFGFGFPQCVEMFATSETLFKRGATFFSRPYEFFRDCIKDLYRDEEKFLALIMIWSRNGRPLLIEELDIPSTSHHLKRVAKNFGFKLRPKLVKVLRKSLKHHEGGFVNYNPRLGSYTFSHNVIGDMVGLVLGDCYPKKILEYISRDFLLGYLTTNSEKKDDFHFFVEEYLYKNLCEILMKMVLNPSLLYTDDNVSRLRSRGNCPNEVIPNFELDSSLCLCDAFDNEKFINVFLDQSQDQKSKERLDKLLTTPVLKMSGHFLGMGVKLEATDICLPEYLLMNQKCLLMKEMINRRMTKVQQGSHELPLLIAVHGDLKEFVSFLLARSVPPAEEAVYIAAMKENCDMIKILMQNYDQSKQPRDKRCTLFNGSSALLAASKKGLTISVRCLIENGADLNYTNTDGLNALDKAMVLNEHKDVCKILVEAGSPLNHRSGKFKRTPLHVAADKGLEEIVRMLLKHKAPTAIKDHRGHYPIHCAAIRGFTGVVRSFLEHDMNLERQRIISYSNKSEIKGMTVFHIAVWTENMELLKVLLEMKVNPDIADVYGRTAFYCAAYEGKADVVNTLIGSVDMVKPEKQGYSPLHAAIHRGHTEIAKRLCPYVDVNARDKYGCTPLQNALKKKNLDMIQTLVEDSNASITVHDMYWMKAINSRLQYDNNIDTTKTCHSLDEIIAVLSKIGDEAGVKRKAEQSEYITNMMKARTQDDTALHHSQDDGDAFM